MNSFSVAFGFVMSHEDPELNGAITVDNNGGRVRYGLNSKAFPFAWVDGPPSLESVINVTRVTFWESLDTLPIKLSSKILDIRFNCGKAKGNKIVQEALSIDADGIFGPLTLSKLKTVPVDQLLQSIIKSQKSYYASLPDYDKYKDGWDKRAEDLL